MRFFFFFFFLSRIYIDQLAKITFHSRFNHTPFGSAPVPILLRQKQITIFGNEVEEGISYPAF